MKLSQLVESEKALISLSEEKLPSKVSMQISRIIREVFEEIKLFNEIKNKKLNEYGVKIEGSDKPNGSYELSFTPENSKLFSEEVTELLESESSFKLSEKVSVSTFDDIKLKPSELNVLNWLLDD